MKTEQQRDRLLKTQGGLTTRERLGSGEARAAVRTAGSCPAGETQVGRRGRASWKRVVEALRQSTCPPDIKGRRKVDLFQRADTCATSSPAAHAEGAVRRVPRAAGAWGCGGGAERGVRGGVLPQSEAVVSDGRKRPEW